MDKPQTAERIIQKTALMGQQIDIIEQIQDAVTLIMTLKLSVMTPEDITVGVETIRALRETAEAIHQDRRSLIQEALKTNPQTITAAAHAIANGTLNHPEPDEQTRELMDALNRTTDALCTTWACLKAQEPAATNP